MSKLLSLLETVVPLRISSISNCLFLPAVFSIFNTSFYKCWSCSVWIFSGVFFGNMSYFCTATLYQPLCDLCLSSLAEFLRSASLSCSRMVTRQSCTADANLNARSYFSDMSLIKVSKFVCTTFCTCQSFLVRILQSNMNNLLQIPIVETAQVSDFLVSHWLHIQPKAKCVIMRNRSLCSLLTFALSTFLLHVMRQKMPVKLTSPNETFTLYLQYEKLHL